MGGLMADPDRNDGRSSMRSGTRGSAGNRSCAFEEAWERGFEEEPGARAAKGSVASAIPNTGRRAAPRLRLSLPARLISVQGNQECILMNLSRSGAQVAVMDPLRSGEAAVLRCGSLEVFGDVIRADFGLNAMRFERELRDEDVLAVRHHYETYEDGQRRSLIETARKWVTGDS